jgi:hypothetical protein
MLEPIVIDACGAARSTKSPKGTLSSMSVQEMIQYLAKHGIKGVSGLKRGDLCEKIVEIQKSNKRTHDATKLKVQIKKKMVETNSSQKPAKLKVQIKQQPRSNQLSKPTLNSSVSHLLQYLQVNNITDNDSTTLRNVISLTTSTPQTSGEINQLQVVPSKYVKCSQLSPLTRKVSVSPPQKKRASATEYSFLPRYDGKNSCYIDSTVIALLHTKSTWTQKHILQKTSMHAKYPILHKLALDIQKQLRDISASHIPSCSQLRRKFKEYTDASNRIHGTKLYDVEWLQTQQEPTDVITMVSHVFDIKDDLIVSVNGDKRTQPFSAPSLQPFDLLHKKEVQLKDYFPVYTNAAKVIYHTARFLWFSINRNNNGDKLYTKVVFPERIQGTQDSRFLQLRSIIVHKGKNANQGHYVCFIKRKKGWYLYDDMHSELQFISSSFSDLMKHDNMYVSKNSTNLVYF